MEFLHVTGALAGSLGTEARYNRKNHSRKLSRYSGRVLDSRCIQGVCCYCPGLGDAFHSSIMQGMGPNNHGSSHTNQTGIHTPSRHLNFGKSAETWMFTPELKCPSLSDLPYHSRTAVQIPLKDSSRWILEKEYMNILNETRKNDA